MRRSRTGAKFVAANADHPRQLRRRWPVPFAGLIADAAGNLYGTTIYSGSAKLGTVFELAKGATFVITLASFTGDSTDGLKRLMVNSPSISASTMQPQALRVRLVGQNTSEPLDIV